MRISWEDPHGRVKYLPAKCIDISESGMRLETQEQVPIHTHISLRAEQLKLAGAATVRHVHRSGAHFIIGLELTQALRDKALAAVQEPSVSLDAHLAGTRA